MKSIAFASFAGLLAVVVPAAHAGVFSVTPVRIYMTPKDRATAVTITNDGETELVMQADVYTWKQKPDGEDELLLSEDLVLSPPILKLGPRARQVVRLAMVSPPRSAEQLTYRLVIREIPEARPAAKDVQLQVALAFSMPVFITPPRAASKVECTAARSAPDTVRASCENRGDAYAQPRELAVVNAAGQRIASREAGAYLLPGVKRSYDIRHADGRIPGGNHKLVVTLDDGTAKSFDVSLAE